MVSSETEIPNSACNCMIRSHARQRTTPCTAGIGPSSTSRERKTLCSSLSLGGAPGEGMLVRPSGPCSLNRITQSRNVWRSIPPILAASFREAPSRTAAIASSRRACAASFARLANRRTSPAVKSVRTATAWPMANDPPFASLNHLAADSGIPPESGIQRLSISLLADHDVLVVLVAVVLGPDRIALALVAARHRPRPREGVVDERDLVIELVRIVLVERQALVNDSLVVVVQLDAAAVDDARALEGPG